MPTHPELHLLRSDTGQLKLLLVLRRCMSKLIEAQSIKPFRLRVKFLVEVGGIGGEEHRGTLGNPGAIFERDSRLRLTMEGDCDTLVLRGVGERKPLTSQMTGMS